MDAGLKPIIPSKKLIIYLQKAIIYFAHEFSAWVGMVGQLPCGLGSISWGGTKHGWMQDSDKVHTCQCLAVDASYELETQLVPTQKTYT